MKAASHSARVFPTPVAGVFATYSAGGRQFGRHWHETYTFGLLDEGAQSWRSGRGQVDAYAGDVINTNPGEVHDGRPLGGPSRCWRMVSVAVTVFAEMTGQSGAHPEITQPVIHDPDLDHALRRLFASIAGDEAACTDAITKLAFEESLVDACVRLVVRHGSMAAPPNASAGHVRVIRELLADDPLNAPSLAAMASLTGLSKFQVLRRFKRDYGLPPHAWLQCQRAERARSLIRQGISLGQAALDTGFADQSHMTRVFRQLYGYTPGVWRRAMTSA
jgi:AraC-like DNA-binding protein